MSCPLFITLLFFTSDQPISLDLQYQILLFERPRSLSASSVLHWLLGSVFLKKCNYCAGLVNVPVYSKVQFIQENSGHYVMRPIEGYLGGKGQQQFLQLS